MPFDPQHWVFKPSIAAALDSSPNVHDTAPACSTGRFGADLSKIQQKFMPAKAVVPPDMRSLIAARNWLGTPVGPAESWPQSLKSVVDLILGSPLAMIVLWGADLIQIYNDAYAVVAGAKHPHALGQRTRDCWPEVWHFNEPVYRAVFAGQAQSFRGQLLLIERNGVPEDAWFDLTYSPLRDEPGETSGVLVTIIETTDRMVADRRMAAAASIQRGRNDGTDLLCKPFALDGFLDKVRAMLVDARVS